MLLYNKIHRMRDLRVYRGCTSTHASHTREAEEGGHAPIHTLIYIVPTCHICISPRGSIEITTRTHHHITHTTDDINKRARDQRAQADQHAQKCGARHGRDNTRDT